jgi:hemolysin activation/secretion protein
MSPENPYYENSRSNIFGRPLLNHLTLLFVVVMACFFQVDAAIGQTATERHPGVVDRPVVDRAEPLDAKKDVKVVDDIPPFQPPEKAKEVVATLTKVEFGGSLILDEATLQAKVASYLNRPITREDIAHLKYDLTKLYFDLGYVLVKVATPPQDVSGGLLKVNIFTGMIGALDIEGHGLLPNSSAKSLASSIIKGEVFREQKVETALQNVNDINNVEARINLRPGQEIGTTDLRLILEQADQDVQTFNIDNYGSELTGRTVAELRLEKGNLFKLGEYLGLDLRVSEDDLHSADAIFTIPLGFGGLMLEADAGWSESYVDPGFYGGLEFSGESRQFGIAISKNLINQNKQKATLRGGLQRRRHESFLDGDFETEDNITQLYIEGSYLKRSPRFVYFASVRISKGVDMLGADDKGEDTPMVDANTRIDGDPRAWIIGASLFGSYLVFPNDSAQVYIRAQKAGDVLLSSDMFSIGGYNSVRGFEPALISGEHGATVSVEWVHSFPNLGNWTINAGPFFDWGKVSNKINTPGVDSILKSAGLGFDVMYSSNGKYTSKLRFDWARTIGDYRSDRVDDDHINLRFTQTF